MAYDRQRLYSVVEDFDSLHVVPMYRVIARGQTLLCNGSLSSCGHFVAAYLAQIAAGADADSACAIALASIGHPREVAKAR